MVGGDGERVEDSKDLQQQRKALHKLTDHVDDRQLHFTRVQEAMASIAASKEADLNAMRLRWHQLILLKHSGFVPHFIKIETMFETERYEGAEYIPPWLLAVAVHSGAMTGLIRSCTGVHGFNISPAPLVRFLLTNVFSIDVGSNVLDYRIHPSIVNSSINYPKEAVAVGWLGTMNVEGSQHLERSSILAMEVSPPLYLNTMAQQGVFTGLAQEIHLLPLRNCRYCHGMAE
ncbi:hypothetical protein M8C21_011293 [Ambrosia artemisiifolia]|uniref:Uncharacterized protein n=1 Tax=Ambrosia artemisiifolia TaxID=4212 RepID=A0AAD5GI43_AMBAR|nr:hypothetical protein M8C21_011293 [Ambrosia artemisiifolia]